jgi:hypothetical protein
MSRETGQRGKEDNLDLPADYAGLLTPSLSGSIGKLAP